jgi:integrase
MPKSVALLVEQAEHQLEVWCYAEFTKWEYRKPWREFAAYCQERDLSSPRRQDGEAFVEVRGWSRVEASRREKTYGRAVMCLFEFDEFGRFLLGKTGPDPMRPPDRWAWAVGEYVALLESRGAAKSTIGSKRVMLTRLLAFADESGVTGFDAVTVGLVDEFLATVKPSERTNFQVFLREYLRFIVDEYGADPGLAGVFTVVLSRNDRVLPSVYSAEEVKRVVAATGGTSVGRRSRAVVLLAVLLGMRVGDIVALRFDQIDWAGKSVSFVQAKTGRRVSLPLPDECVFALLDYMRNERPACGDPHVFVKAKAPFTALSRDYNFAGIITGCFRRAHVDTSGRHHGLHAFRHSAAVNLLYSQTPYPVVSGVLGHACVTTTTRYLRVDVEHLRPLSLEVPDES